MVKQILTAAGFVEGVSFKETRFITPPKTTYAVYLDSFVSRGADDLNLIKDHSTSIELYEYAPDPESEARIEAQFDSIGQKYEKADRIWIDEEQLYQVVYDFEYTEKQGGFVS